MLDPIIPVPAMDDQPATEEPPRPPSSVFGPSSSNVGPTSPVVAPTIDSAGRVLFAEVESDDEEADSRQEQAGEEAPPPFGYQVSY